MLDKHDHLLSRDERCEVFKRPTVVVRLELGPVAFPSDATGNGEQVVHELGRTRDSNIDGAVAEARRTSLIEVALPALNDCDGSLHRGRREGLISISEDFPLRAHRALGGALDPAGKGDLPSNRGVQSPIFQGCTRALGARLASIRLRAMKLAEQLLCIVHSSYMLPRLDNHNTPMV